MESISEILLLEDDPVHADLVSRALRKVKPPVVLRHCLTLDDAEKYLSANKPSIILADYRLADGDCSELIRQYALIYPFVVLTSIGNDDLAVELMRLGAEDYWVKGPVLYDLIPEILQRVHRSWEVRQEKRRELLAELQRARFEAEAAHRSKQAFLSNMGHEVRTPMNIILGMTHLVMHSTEDSNIKGYLQKASDSAKRLLRILNDVLDYASMEAGALELDHIHFDLDDLLSEAGGAIKAEALRKGLELVIDVHPSVPRRLIGDPVRLGRILYNLVGNAIKFTEKGYVKLQTTMLGESEDRVELQFSVVDTGIGISKDYLQHIFQPFDQGDSSLSRKHSGIGLGLSICRKLVELMKGEIWCESEVGAGSKFMFKVWITRDQHVDSAPDLQGIQGLKVLVVDDSVHALDAIDSMLRSLKIRPSFAKSGEEALLFLSKSNIRKEVPDLVIMDWLMPEMDGVETLKKINQDDRLSPKPAVVMMTAGSKEDLQTHIGEQPVSGVLSKPFTFSQLLDVILDARGQVQSEELSGTIEKNSELQQIKGSKILVVDDNMISRSTCRKMLEEAGAEVEIAANGEDALELVFHNAFDLVIMDCQMPTMDGYEAARRIRRNTQFAQLPIIAMTASALMEDRVRTILAGMNEHISKPIEQPAFLDAVERWLRYSRQFRRNSSDQFAIGVGADLYEVDGPEKILSEAGFDVPIAIARLAGDWVIYRNMLFGFAKNHAHAPEEIKRALEMGEIPKAVRIAHSLKSVAAYLGIVSLQSLAKTIEDHAGVIRMTDVYVLLDELKVVLDRSLDVVVAYQKELLETTDSTDQNKVDVSQLESLLESSDSSAVDMAHAFAKKADDSERGQLAKKVEDLASRYQYIEALEALRIWKGK